MFFDVDKNFGLFRSYRGVYYECSMFELCINFSFIDNAERDAEYRSDIIFIIIPLFLVTATLVVTRFLVQPWRKSYLQAKVSMIVYKVYFSTK